METSPCPLQTGLRKQFCPRRTLSHRHAGWCGDHVSGLQAPAPGVYQRHRPETTALYEVVKDNLETLYGAIGDGAIAGPLPKPARKELESYLDCGLLCRGYVVTQSVLSLRHADAVAGDDHATAPPPARTRARGSSYRASRTGRPCARWILDEAAERVGGR